MLVPLADELGRIVARVGGSSFGALPGAGFDVAPDVEGLGDEVEPVVGSLGSKRDAGVDDAEVDDAEVDDAEVEGPDAEGADADGPDAAVPSPAELNLMAGDDDAGCCGVSAPPGLAAGCAYEDAAVVAAPTPGVPLGLSAVLAGAGPDGAGGAD